MIALIICISIFIFTVYMIRKHYLKKGQWGSEKDWWWFSTSFVSLFIAWLCFYLLLGFCKSFSSYKTEEIVKFNYNIYGLEYKTQENTYTKGVFFLGIGGFESSSKTKEEYYFYSERKYGKHLEKLSTKTRNGNKIKVYINETDDEKPSLKTIYKVTSSNGGLDELLYGKSESKEIIGKILTVPKNTIKIDYEIDI